MEEVKYKFETNEQTGAEQPKESEIDTKFLFVPQRMENESFEQYKERRLVANYKLHQMVKGKLIWNSREQGTYVK